MLTIPTMKEDMTAFLITGDSSRNKVQTMPGGGFETVAIEMFNFSAISLIVIYFYRRKISLPYIITRARGFVNRVTKIFEKR